MHWRRLRGNPRVLVYKREDLLPHIALKQSDAPVAPQSFDPVWPTPSCGPHSARNDGSKPRFQAAAACFFA